MFKDVYNAVYDQLENDPNLDYIKIFQGQKQNYPQQAYILMIEPTSETEARKRDYEKVNEFIYKIDIVVLMNVKKPLKDIILGWTDGGETYKGLLEFTDDIKGSIRKAISDLRETYNTNAYSESTTNTSDTFILTPTVSDITVLINGKTKSGYDSINCGGTTLNGNVVASNIQTAVRALGQYTEDGYLNATVTFDTSTNQFKIESGYGPNDSVVVTAGTLNDCSTLLGFDNPTEDKGKNIIDYVFEPVNLLTVEGDHQTRARGISLIVTEEIYVGGN